jgi:hypothetical protein
MTREVAEQLTQTIEDIANRLRGGADLARDGCDENEFARIRSRLEDVADQILGTKATILSMIDHETATTGRIERDD